MNALRVKTCAKLFMPRKFHTSFPRSRPIDPKFKELQRQMQVDDGVPVYVKKGPIDKMIFACVSLGVAIALGDGLHTCYKLIYPKPN